MCINNKIVVLIPQRHTTARNTFLSCDYISGVLQRELHLTTLNYFYTTYHFILRCYALTQCFHLAFQPQKTPCFGTVAQHCVDGNTHMQYILNNRPVSLTETHRTSEMKAPLATTLTDQRVK